MSKAIKKVINVIIDVLVIVILVVSVLVVVLSLTSKSSGVPNLFGYAPLSVQSDSMADTFCDGDLIFSKVSTGAQDTFQKGDIVSFHQSIEGEEQINTHRIVDVVKEGGVDCYKTQGDNAKTNPEPDKELKRSTDILAVYTGAKLSGLGYIFSFIRTQFGFFMVVLLPMILFFVYEMIRVVLNILAYNREKAMEEAAELAANADLTDEQKQRAIAEYLAQQTANQHDGATVQTPAVVDVDNAENATNTENL